MTCLLNSMLIITLVFVLGSPSIRAACVDRQANMSYCAGVFNYLVDENINVTAADNAAFAAYQADMAIWSNNRDVGCEVQVPNASMCNNCLVIRRRLHCIEQFPICISSSAARPMCKGYCKTMDFKLKHTNCPKKTADKHLLKWSARALDLQYKSEFS